MTSRDPISWPVNRCEAGCKVAFLANQHESGSSASGPICQSATRRISAIEAILAAARKQTLAAITLDVAVAPFPAICRATRSGPSRIGIAGKEAAQISLTLDNRIIATSHAVDSDKSSVGGLYRILDKSNQCDKFHRHRETRVVKSRHAPKLGRVFGLLPHPRMRRYTS